MSSHDKQPLADRDASRRDDEELRAMLESLDPGRAEPGYWIRFHRAVMARAAGELARRRRVIELTVSDMVSSWARAVVPTALLAAAVGGLMLVELPVTGPEQAMAPLRVEELLLDGLEENAIPAMLSDESLEELVGVRFAGDIY